MYKCLILLKINSGQLHSRPLEHNIQLINHLYCCASAQRTALPDYISILIHGISLNRRFIINGMVSSSQTLMEFSASQNSFLFPSSLTIGELTVHKQRTKCHITLSTILISATLLLCNICGVGWLRLWCVLDCLLIIRPVRIFE